MPRYSSPCTLLSLIVCCDTLGGPAPRVRAIQLSTRMFLDGGRLCIAIPSRNGGAACPRIFSRCMRRSSGCVPTTVLLRRIRRRATIIENQIHPPSTTPANKPPMTSPASVPGSRFDLLVPLTEGEAETVEVDVVTIVLVNELVIGAEDKWIEVVMKVVEVNELELVLLGILVVLVEDSDVLELDEVNDMSSTEDIENIGIA